MIELIPAIDIIEGQCVRLTKGDYGSKTVYPLNPVDLARRFEDLGFKRLHVVDLDGAKSNHVVNLDILEKITSTTNLSVDFGGGIKTDEDITHVFSSGAKWVTIGSLAVKNPNKIENWITQYGADKIILGADVKDGFIHISGWKENSSVKLFDFLNSYQNKGINNILCTDINKDGTLKGPATSLYRQIMSAYPDCHLIASGGISSIDDMNALDKAGIPAVVFGKAIYEGRIDLSQVAKQFNL